MVWFISDKLSELVRKQNTVGEKSPNHMKRQDELQVPVEEVEQLALTLDNLVEGWDQALISALLLRHLFLDVFSQVTYRCNIIINFVELASDEKYSNLMKDNCRRVHEFHFESLRCHFLAEC